MRERAPRWPSQPMTGPSYRSATTDPSTEWVTSIDSTASSKASSASLSKFTNDAFANEQLIGNPANQLLAFASDRGGSSQIWVLDPDDGKMRDMKPDLSWLKVGGQHIIPKPGVWKYPPLTHNIIYS